MSEEAAVWFRNVFLLGKQIQERRMPSGRDAFELFSHQVHASNSSVTLANQSLNKVRSQIKRCNQSRGVPRRVQAET